MKYSLYYAEVNNSAVGMPARIFMRGKLGTRIDLLNKVPVYLTKCNHDMVSGKVLLEKSIKMLKQESPFWTKNIELFKSIMTTDEGGISTFFLSDRCCAVNPWKIPPYSDEARAIYFAAYIVGALCMAVLLDERLGYLGIRHRRLLSLKAEIRFLRRCISNENYLEVLTAMGLCYKLVDKIRPRRNYHSFFLQYDVKKWKAIN